MAMRTLLLTTTLCLASWTTAWAQTQGDPEAGQALAREVCANCHAVLPGEGVDPDPDPLPFEELVPLPFEDIANTPGVTPMALIAWLTTSHPTMPDIILKDEELRNVVAYILSLKEDH
jgi:mono/diheme cytochrome c family protein